MIDDDDYLDPEDFFDDEEDNWDIDKPTWRKYILRKLFKECFSLGGEKLI